MLRSTERRSAAGGDATAGGFRCARMASATSEETVESTSQQPSSLAVLTSGGDAPGMNAAVRAVVRTGLHYGIDVHVVLEGYQGMVNGEIRLATSHDVGGILHRGGTVIGSARCDDFRTREGRRTAARNLVERGIDRLIVIGGDGSLTGANVFREEWPELLSELVANGEIEQALADDHPNLVLVGLVGSIDNDMFGTDMTIGADTALHRITEAIDAIHSTASSHQRSFVVEVMGRNSGYLALMSALATGANWVLIPESPPDTDEWEDSMCRALEAGRAIGRRSHLVVVAEGAQDRHGNPITAQHVQEVLESRLGEDTRVTILGHVQRGGAPSAFDRYLSTVLGHAAVRLVRNAPPNAEPRLVGIRENQVIDSPLMECVRKTQAVAGLIADHDYEKAMAMRGGSFSDSFQLQRTLVRAQPRPPEDGDRRFRLAVLHGGGPSPGMNTAVRVAVRVGLEKGHTMLGVHNGFRGLERGHFQEMDWMSVNGWVSYGGAELGTSRYVPTGHALQTIASQLREHEIDGLLVVGGWDAYQSAYEIYSHRLDHPALDIPIICMPASINNDLPGSELSIGSDTALNSIVGDVDKIKQSAVASRRCFVVEVMGHDSGYLALMSGLATGAERVYLPEEEVTLRDLEVDVRSLIDGFEHGKRLGLMIRNENSDPVYTSDFMASLFEKEGGDLFDVRQAILGHVQQGGTPSPFDRIQATRLAARCAEFLIDQVSRDFPTSAVIGLDRGRIDFTPLADLPVMIETDAHRPKVQRWMALRPLARVMARPEDHSA